MKQDKVLAALSIAAKAGYIASGEYQTEHAVKSAQACLVIVASDASDNTKKMFRNMCSYNQIPMEIYGNRESIGHCIGKEFRASLAVTDKGLADTVQKKLSEITTE